MLCLVLQMGCQAKKFQKLSYGSKTLYMTSEGLGEMFEGDSADMCAGKFPLVLMGGRVEGLVCADQGARTPIGDSGILLELDR